MERVFKTIDTYDMGNDWMVDVVTTTEDYEAWIYNDNYGIKQLMWCQPKEQTHYGTSKKQETYEEFLDLIIANFEEYKDNYMEALQSGF